MPEVSENNWELLRAKRRYDETKKGDSQVCQKLAQTMENHPPRLPLAMPIFFTGLKAGDRHHNKAEIGNIRTKQHGS